MVYYNKLRELVKLRNGPLINNTARFSLSVLSLSSIFLLSRPVQSIQIIINGRKEEEEGRINNNYF